MFYIAIFIIIQYNKYSMVYTYFLLYTRMKEIHVIKHIFIFVVLLSFAASIPAVGQEKSTLGVEKFRDKRMLDFFLNLSSVGTGVGAKMHFTTDNPDLRYSFGFQIGGVRGENEYSYIDPYTYNYYRGNRQFFTMMVPFTFGFKRRVWRDDIESDFRPFFLAEAGPVFGISFPTGDGFSHGLKSGRGQITGGGFIGFGIDFGKETERTFGVTLGIHFINFPETLGEKKGYNGFFLRLNYLNFLQ